MRVVYTETDEPTVSFDGRELVLHVSRYAQAIAPTPLPSAAIKLEADRRTHRKIVSTLRIVSPRRGLGDFGDFWVF